VGYDSTSAFIARFREVLGNDPRAATMASYTAPCLHAS